MKKSWKWSGVLLAGLGAAGCANVEVKRVPVDERAQGADAQIKGFRYYLGRPYVIVKHQVILSTIAVPTKLVEIPSKVSGGKSVYFLVGLEKHQVFDINGAERLDLSWDKLKDGSTPSPQKVGEIMSPTMTPVTYQGAGTLPSGGMIINSPTMTKATTPSPAPTPTPSGADSSQTFQVVMLPDFEEQYTIKNCNVLAQTSYDLSFTNGMLTQAGGSYNATVVPVRILQSVQQALGSKSDTVKNSTDSLPIPSAAGGTAPKFEIQTTGAAVFYVCQDKILEPGIYRLQKSWERREAVANQMVAEGQSAALLTEMGLPAEDTVTVLSSDDYKARSGKSSGK